MLQRMYCGSHFLSDLFGSAAVGLGWCYICYHPKLIGNVFDKMEAVQHPKRRTANTDEPSFALPSSKLTMQTPPSPDRAHTTSPAPSFTKDPLPSSHGPLKGQCPRQTLVAPSGAPSGKLQQGVVKTRQRTQKYRTHRGTHPDRVCHRDASKDSGQNRPFRWRRTESGLIDAEAACI